VSSAFLRQARATAGGPRQPPQCSFRPPPSLPCRTGHLLSSQPSSMYIQLVHQVDRP
jgi:hypothetical protein